MEVDLEMRLDRSLAACPVNEYHSFQSRKLLMSLGVLFSKTTVTSFASGIFDIQLNTCFALLRRCLLMVDLRVH